MMYNLENKKLGLNVEDEKIIEVLQKFNGHINLSLRYLLTVNSIISIKYMNKINLILISILIIFLFFIKKMTMFGSKFKNGYKFINKDTKEVCNKLYLFFDNKEYKIIENLIPNNICNNIINEAKLKTKDSGWLKKRHDNYPTTDIPFDKNWENYNFIYNKITNKIFNVISNMYNVKIKKLSINELFVVKYSTEGQRELEYHEDGSEFSFIIGLNYDYRGGGTTFKFNNKNIKLNVGSCLIFSGQNYS